MPRPNRRYLSAVAIVSGSALAYEVLLMRLFSIIQWHHFASMIISLALLGYGASGTFLALYRGRLEQFFSSAIMSNMALFSMAMPLCFLIAQQLPFNPAELFWNPLQAIYLFCIYLLLAVPFFFAANVIGLSFYHYREAVPSLYSADLLGAGVGSAGIILLLYLFFPLKILMALTLLSAAAALMMQHWSFDRQPAETKSYSGILVITLIVIVLITALSTLNISPYKGLSQLLQIPGASVIGRSSSPLGLIEVVKSNTTPLRHAPGLSLNATAEPPEQLAVFTDADGLSAITRYQGNPDAVRYLDQTTSALPYYLRPFNEILILGAGTGSDTLQALMHNPKHIDAVEINPQVIDLVKEKYAGFAGGIYNRGDIALHTGEARGYLASTAKSYDQINLSLLDSFGVSSGLYSMAENYLYTEEAIRAYLGHLSREGYLSITRWTRIPPRDEIKLLATVTKVLNETANSIPARQLMMIRSWQTSTLIVKNGLVSAGEIARLKQFCETNSFDPVYYPGITEQEVNRFNIQLEPYLYQAVTALLSKDRQAFIEDYKFNIEPSTDDRPYFFHFFKWRTLAEILDLLHSGGIFLLESGYLLLFTGLLQAVVAVLLLIVLPLRLMKEKLGERIKAASRYRALSYFFLIGLAFLFVEIAFIQKFILILHHPLYAVTLVLSTFLLAAGLGSRFSAQSDRFSRKNPVLLPVSAIVGLSLFYLLNLDWLTGLLLQSSGFNRALISFCLIAPLGFFMGMPFPLGMNKLAVTASELIPWAWGINGFASVVSAILATLVAMEFGFNALIILAVVLYAAAAFCFPRPRLNAG